MIKDRYMLILLVLGLSFLPLILGFYDVPKPPGNGTLLKVHLTKLHPKNMNASEIFMKRVKARIAKKKVGRQMLQMTIPFFDTLESVPKFLRELNGTAETNSTQMNNKTVSISTLKEDKPKLYARLLRVLVQHVWNDTWELFHRKPIVRVDEV